MSGLDASVDPAWLVILPAWFLAGWLYTRLFDRW